jgi:hypothetical protein
MKKISTLYKKNPQDLSRVIDEVNPENSWVFEGAIATRKFDGVATAIISGDLYKRYDVKRGKTAPVGAIPCQEPDEITGHHPHWVKCDRDNPSDKLFFEAFDCLDNKEDDTYELCGEKISTERFNAKLNVEKIEGHKLIRHGCEKLNVPDLSFDGIRKFLDEHDIEGIVFYHPTDDRMCKIRKKDFGIKR